MDRSELEASMGKMCVFVSASGKFGISRFTVQVDCIVSKLGRRTWISLKGFSMFLSGIS